MALRLSDTREVVERSLFESIRSVTSQLGYLPDMNELSQVTISVINQGQNKITLTGVDLRNYYLPARKFNIIESTGNNGEYTVVSSIYQGGNTVITTLESIASSTADGKASIYIYYDDSTGIAYYNSAMNQVIASKGFAVEVFGVGQPRAKYQKKVPRIVLIPNQSLPGALGGNNDPIYIPVGIDPLSPDSYTAHVTPPQTVDLTIDAHLVSSTAEQARVLHGILALAMPKRGYLPLYNNPEVRFFIEAFSYRNIPNPGDNIVEDVYMYKASDMYETENEIIAEGIVPITQINVDMKLGTKDKPNSAIKFGDDLVITPDE